MCILFGDRSSFTSGMIGMLLEGEVWLVVAGCTSLGSIIRERSDRVANDVEFLSFFFASCMSTE